MILNSDPLEDYEPLDLATKCTVNHSTRTISSNNKIEQYSYMEVGGTETIDQ